MQRSNEEVICSQLAKHYRDEMSFRIKRGMAMAKARKNSIANNSTERVLMKLEKWQIPYLIGAIRLGIFVEHWSASLTYSIGCCDSHSLRWKNKVGDIISTIVKQTGVDEENTEHGLWYVGAISELVNKVVVVNEEDRKKSDDEELEKCNVIAETVKNCIELTIPKEKITKEFVDGIVRTIIGLQFNEENE